MIEFLLMSCAAGCSPGPSSELVSLEASLECGMTVDQVGPISGHDFHALEVPIGWITHIMHAGKSELYFGFREGKLESIQVAWQQLPTRIATFQRVDLCRTTNDPMASTPLKNRR